MFCDPPGMAGFFWVAGHGFAGFRSRILDAEGAGSGGAGLRHMAWFWAQDCTGFGLRMGRVLAARAGRHPRANRHRARRQEFR